MLITMLCSLNEDCGVFVFFIVRFDNVKKLQSTLFDTTREINKDHTMLKWAK
jgi:hypothetical protein